MPAGQSADVLSYLALLRVGFGHRRVTAVGRALLPPVFTLTGASRRQEPGGMVSVPLSVAPTGSTRLGVTQHPARWSPDFPPAWYAQNRRPSSLQTCSPRPEYVRPHPRATLHSEPTAPTGRRKTLPMSRRPLLGRHRSAVARARVGPAVSTGSPRPLLSCPASWPL